MSRCLQCKYFNTQAAIQPPEGRLYCAVNPAESHPFGTCNQWEPKEPSPGDSGLRYDLTPPTPMITAMHNQLVELQRTEGVINHIIDSMTSETGVSRDRIRQRASDLARSTGLTYQQALDRIRNGLVAIPDPSSLDLDIHQSAFFQEHYKVTLKPRWSSGQGFAK